MKTQSAVPFTARQPSWRSRFSRRVAILSIVGLIAVPSALAGTYFSGSIAPGASKSSGFNYWSSDTVNRATGNPFTLWFSNSAGAHQVTSDTYHNPFSINGSWGYDQAWCQSNTNITLTATCSAS